MPLVTLLPNGVQIEIDNDETIVDGLRRSGVRSPYKCRRGGCGACRTRLVDGKVTYSRPVADSVLSNDDIEAGLCLPCRARPTTDIVIDLGTCDRLRSVLATVHRTTNINNGK